MPYRSLAILLLLWILICNQFIDVTSETVVASVAVDIDGVGTINTASTSSVVDTPSQCLIPVSLGELYDKYSILQIKLDRINDSIKQQSIRKELDMLHPYITQYKLDNTYSDRLKNINIQLWEIEDKIRIKEGKKEFDDEFIQLARSVYIVNDERFVVKNEISILLSSDIYETKSYEAY